MAKSLLSGTLALMVLFPLYVIYVFQFLQTMTLMRSTTRRTRSG